VRGARRGRCALVIPAPLGPFRRRGGFSGPVALGPPPSSIAVSVAPRPQCVHIRWVPGRLQGVRGVAVEAFAEVPVDVEDRLDTGMSKPGGDDTWGVRLR